MRIAFLVTAYRDLEHLQRLCRVLRTEDPSCHVMVQLDVGSPLATSARSLPEVEVLLTSKPVHWGDGSYASEMVRSIRHLMAHEWDWLCVLSGQDYLIR